MGRYVLGPLAANTISSYMKSRYPRKYPGHGGRRRTSSKRAVRRRRTFIRTRLQNKKKKQFQSKIAKQSGTTNTTTKLIVRKTPKEQRFLRKLFKTNPTKQKYVNRFGFNWLANEDCSKTIWYSVTNLKFNNVSDYMKSSVCNGGLMTAGASITATNSNYVANSPDRGIYIGKCTYQYELYNPTNYIMTVYIYDLVCKHDTPDMIDYANATGYNCAPESMMRKSTTYVAAGDSSWAVGDPTSETNSTWDTVGMKPTDYHMFNTFWKVKGMKKLILPPQTSHHHTVVFNPKKLITQASLYYPRTQRSSSWKGGIAGITQSTLFGFEGQVAASRTDSTGAVLLQNNGDVGTLPGKLIIKMVRKQNIWDCPLRYNVVQSESALQTTMYDP
ncbi:MAG: hypothetical protein J6T10_08470, partial [Methanobrevibacter sp.]|nr:hypothetical protein [Methanobrevibacter sp.]